MGIFPDEIFSYLKNKILTLFIGEADAEFVSVEANKKRGGHGEEEDIEKEKEKEKGGRR